MVFPDASSTEAFRFKRPQEFVPRYAFRTFGTEGLVGDRLLMAQIEHDFGSMVFRWLGVKFLKDLRISLYVGSGWSELTSTPTHQVRRFIWSTKQVFHEIGFSLGLLSPLPISYSFTWPLTHRERFRFSAAFGTGFLQ